MKYFGNYVENAVIREDENGVCWAKLWSNYAPGKGKLTSEYKLGENSDMRYGTIEYEVNEITLEEYESFGKTWKFGSTFEERVTPESTYYNKVII